MTSPGADLYILNPQYTNPGNGRPMNADPKQPIRNAFNSNLALQLLGLGPIPDSTWNYDQSMQLTYNYPLRVSSDTPARYYRLGEGGAGTITAGNSAAYPQPDPSAGNGVYATTAVSGAQLIATASSGAGVRFDGAKRGHSLGGRRQWFGLYAEDHRVLVQRRRHQQPPDGV